MDFCESHPVSRVVPQKPFVSWLELVLHSPPILLSINRHLLAARRYSIELLPQKRDLILQHFDLLLSAG